MKPGLPNSWANGSLWDMTSRGQVVTFIGAGGKTTCLRSLTQEIESMEQQVIATTTTKVFPEKLMNSWKNPNPPSFEQEGACFWYIDVMEGSGKWIGPPLEAVDEAIERARAVLDEGAIHELPLHASGSTKTVPKLPKLPHWVIEGDGARGLKLKCWESHEPQIPQQSDCVVLVLDGSLWGRVLQAEDIHRPAVCQNLVGHVWNAEKAWGYILKSPVFAPKYRHMSGVVLLNARAARDSDQPLLELRHRWAEIQRDVNDLEYRPKHLRLAAGDAKEGKLQWFELW